MSQNLDFMAATWNTGQTITHTVIGYPGVPSGSSVTVTTAEDVTLVLGNVTAQTSRAGSGVSVRLPGTTGGQSAAVLYANGAGVTGGAAVRAAGDV